MDNLDNEDSDTEFCENTFVKFKNLLNNLLFKTRKPTIISTDTRSFR